MRQERRPKLLGLSLLEAGETNESRVCFLPLLEESV